MLGMVNAIVMMSVWIFSGCLSVDGLVTLRLLDESVDGTDEMI